MNARVRGAVSALAALGFAVSLAPGCGGADGGPDGAAAQPLVVVYKTPTCSCCTRWTEHLRGAGFRVEEHALTDLRGVKERLGVPPALASCHTATVGGYVIEGHVPATDLRRLLDQRPPGRGLAVPGMPVGSPGMEQGGRTEPYAVFLWDAEGASQAFSAHGGQGR